MADFKLGDNKEVGIQISSNDGTSFSVTATYKYISRSNQVISSGTARIESSKVFALVEPQLGMGQKVVFTCVVTPLKADGTVDVSKNVQTIVGEVTVNVSNV